MVRVSVNVLSSAFFLISGLLAPQYVLASPLPEALKPLEFSTALGTHFTSSVAGNNVSNDLIKETFAYDLGLDYRLFKYFSGGLHFFHGLYSLDVPAGTPSGASAGMSFKGLLLSPRGRLAIGPVDTFLEAGLGWSWFSSHTEYGAFSSGFSAHGPVFAFGAGGLYNITDFVGAGIAMRYNFPAFVRLCVDINGAESCGTPSSNMKDLFIGAMVSVNIHNLVNFITGESSESSNNTSTSSSDSLGTPSEETASDPASSTAVQPSADHTTATPASAPAAQEPSQQSASSSTALESNAPSSSDEASPTPTRADKKKSKKTKVKKRR